MRRKITIGIFCILLFAFTLASILTPDRDISERENRVLTTKDDLILSEIVSGEFQETYEEYVDDQFFLRDSWVNLATSALTLIGKKDINRVYIGLDGYLLEKYTEEDFDDELVEYNIDVLAEYMNEMAATYGSDHVNLLMIPCKANAMSDYLPTYAYTYPEEEIMDAICGLLEDESIFLDLTEVLNEHQDEYIYYRTDHHWTSLGAYYAYAAYAEAKGFEAAALVSFEAEVVSEDFYGTTYNSLQQDVEADTVTIYHSHAEDNLSVDMNDGETVSDSFYFYDALEDSDKYSVFLSGNTEKIVIRTGAETGRTLLLIKDSFANSFVPFLAGDYDAIIMYDLRYASDTIDVLLNQYGEDITDVLVLYNVEKFMQDDSVDFLAY